MTKRLSVAIVLLLVGALLGTLATRSFLQGQQPLAPPATPKELTSYRDIVKGVLPAVVSIESKAKPAARERRRGRTQLDPRVPDEFRRFFEDVQPPEDSDDGPGRLGFGSGFLVDPKGVILTNNHVVEGAEEVLVELQDGRKFTSKNIKTDAKTDLAIVRLDTKDTLPYLELDDSDRMEIGDRVLAIGAPFGLVGSVTHGIVSGKGRSLRMNMYEDFLQTDAAINPGNSGGPLISLEGEVIGINSAIKTRTGGFQGVGLAISSKLAKDVMQQLLKNGVVKRGYLGVQIKDLSEPALAERLGLKKGEQGVLVTRAIEGAPAVKGGVKEGDVITSINSVAIHDGRDLQWVVARLPLGKPVKVRVLRDGKPTLLDVVIEEQPEKLGSSRGRLPKALEREPESVGISKLGIRAADLTPDLAESLGYGEKMKGALVTSVKRDSPAASDLMPGLLITKVDATPVRSVSALRSAVEAASLSKGVLLQVQVPQGGMSFVLVKSESSRGE